MLSLNSIVIAGRLTCDPKVYDNKNKFARLSLAYNHNVKTSEGKKQESFFYEATVFGALAEFAERNLSKGDECIVAGQLLPNTWTTETGEMKMKISIVGSKLEKVWRFEQSGQNGYGQNPSYAKKEKTGGSSYQPQYYQDNNSQRYYSSDNLNKYAPQPQNKGNGDEPPF